MGIAIFDRKVSDVSSECVYMDDGTSRRITYDNTVYITEEKPINDDEINVGVTFDITKSSGAEGLVSGWASVATNADGSLPLDWQDDVVRAEVLEKAAINFMLDYRDSGVMHQGDSKGTVVESIVFTKEKQACIGIPEGTVPEGWFITVKISDPEVFAKVKNGTFKMFSIQGKAKRIKL